LPAVGDVKATDPDAMVITIVLQSGDEQKLNVAKDAQITRDGNSASIGQVQRATTCGPASIPAPTRPPSRSEVEELEGA